jgi:hypothetical protein
MTREERFMPNGIPKHVRIYDNGGETFDQYTVVFTGNFKNRNHTCYYLGMSTDPYHPQGFGQHGESKDIIDRPTYAHLGKKIKFQDLPERCQDCVIQDYKEIWRI